MFVVTCVVGRLVSEVIFLLSGLKQPDPNHVSLLRYISEYLPFPTYGIVYIQIPAERLLNTSSTNLLFGSKDNHYYRYYNLVIQLIAKLFVHIDPEFLGDSTYPQV